MVRETSAKNKIAIIGSGHMGYALASGLVQSGIHPGRITVASPSVLRNQKLKKLGVRTAHDNQDAVRSARWIFLAVKPAVVSSVFHEIKQYAKDKSVVSLVAGIHTETLQAHASAAHIARIMPNIPIAIGKGVIGCFTGNLSKKEGQELWDMLSGLGTVLRVKSERELDIVTLLSGCGPGIVAFLIAAFATAAKTLGLSSKEANAIALQTFNGTLAYLTHAGILPEDLMRSVATKGGVTETILVDFAKRSFAKNFMRALAAGHAQIKRLQK